MLSSSKLNILSALLVIISCIQSVSIIITLWGGIHILTDDKEGDRYYNIIIPYLWLDAFGFATMGFITNKIQNHKKSPTCKEIPQSQGNTICSIDSN